MSFQGSLTLEDKAAAPARPDAAKPPVGRRGPPPGKPGPHGGRENMPPGNRNDPPPNHRPTRSQEEALRARKAQAEGKLIDIETSNSPPRRQERRPRRNSESSIAPGDKFLTVEERSQRYLRRRERERRAREAGLGGKDRKPVSRKIDIIDQLDATSIYGTGSKFTCLRSAGQKVIADHVLQSSTMMGLSMRSILTAIGTAAAVPLCKLSPRAHSTTRLVAPGH